MKSYVRDVPGGCELTVKVVPGAARDRIVGPLGDALKMQVTAPPERGRANERVAAVLAAALGVAPRQVEVVFGQTMPRKRVRIRGLGAAEASRRLGGG